MKKIRNILLIILLAGVFTLSACTAGNAAQTTTSSAQTTAAATEPSTGTSTSPIGNPPSGSPPAGNPPQGNPPGGNPPGGNPPGGGSGSDAASVTLSGAYTLDGQTTIEDGQAYDAADADQSAVYVLNGGNLTLTQATITSSGDSSSSDASSFYGLNAGVLAAAGSSISLSGSTVSTTGDGANGVFATGSGAVINLSNSSVTAAGQYAHAVMATQGGTLTVTNVDMNTAGANSGAIATDRGGGTINVTGGKIVTTGANSPTIYSTGSITVTDAELSASGSEAAVIEGGNTITLKNSDLSSSFEGKWGVMIYQSMSGDAEGTRGTFTMTDGSLAYTSKTGPLFYVNNSTGIINLKNVTLTVASGVLINAAAGTWGTSGSNGGNVVFTADQQTLSGDILADSISSVSVTLQNNSDWTGAINSEHSAREADLSLDGSSTWIVSADSYLTKLSDSAGISGTTVSNIIGNGHTVYYDASANAALGGKTYTLSGGGQLKPLQ